MAEVTTHKYKWKITWRQKFSSVQISFRSGLWFGWRWETSGWHSQDVLAIDCLCTSISNEIYGKICISYIWSWLVVKMRLLKRQRKLCLEHLFALHMVQLHVNGDSGCKPFQETKMKYFYIIILLMEEILHHLGWIIPCKSWDNDKLHINWCRISWINSIIL